MEGEETSQKNKFVKKEKGSKPGTSKGKHKSKQSTKKLKDSKGSLYIHAALLSLSEAERSLSGLLAKSMASAIELASAKKHIFNAVLGEKNLTENEKNLSLAFLSSIRTLPGYCTLDIDHVNDINMVVSRITKYADDTTLKRPLNILMIASSGAGKSHFIECLAARMANRDLRPITYNMAAMERSEDLIQPLDTARNLKVEDKLPLLFLDEFDASPKNYAVLLPLLWDGEIHLGHRDLKLGKLIIVLAGSKPNMPDMIEAARSMQTKEKIISEQHAETPKFIDFLSRINGGVINIPDLDIVDDNRDRPIDKVCIAIGLLLKRFGPDLSVIPRSLLRFIAITKFRYGVRSIASLIDFIPNLKNTKIVTRIKLKLPFDKVIELKKSSLAYHLIDEDQAHGIIEKWKHCESNDTEIIIGQTGLSSMAHTMASEKGKEKINLNVES